jgi:hypothetical protein
MCSDSADQPAHLLVGTTAVWTATHEDGFTTGSSVILKEPGRTQRGVGLLSDLIAPVPKVTITRRASYRWRNYDGHDSR